MLHKLLTILLLAVATILPQNISGTGTYTDPYVLYNAADVDSIRMYLYDYTGVGRMVKFKLANDIDMSGTTFMHGTQKWFPLYISVADTFNFDGDGHWIRNMTVKWDTTRHPVTGYAPINAGFIGLYDAPQLAPDQIKRDSIGNVNFDNVVVIWDSSTKSSSSAPAFEHGAAAFVGEIGEGGSNGEGLYFHDIYIKNAYVRAVTLDNSWTTQGWAIGVAFGASLTNSASNAAHYFERIGVDSSAVYMDIFYPFNYIGAGGFFGRTEGQSYTVFEECFIANSSLYFNIPAARYEFTSQVNLGMFAGSSSIGLPPDFSDIAIYGNTITVNGILGGASDVEVAGIFIPYTNASTSGWRRIYAGNNSYLKINATSEAPDNHGFWIGYRISDVQDTTCFIDTTGFANTTPSWYGLYGEDSDAQTNPVQSKSAANMIASTSMYTAEGWDMLNVWDMDPVIWGGYPYPLWARDYLLIGNIDITTGPSGVYQWPDSINLVWTSEEVTSYFHIWYSTNNGLNWTFIDSTANNDTTYTWVMPNLDSDEMQIRISDNIPRIYDISSSFTIIPGPEINILHPVNYLRTISFGDTTHVVIQTARVDSLVLFFSQDSMATWTLISGIAIDTVNGFFYDTTTYVWTMNLLGTGDVYLKVGTQADTTVYFGPGDVTLNQIGIQGLGTPIFCTYEFGSRTPLERLTYEDPSCGWSNPPQTARSFLINSDGTDYDVYSQVCDGDCDEASEWLYRTPLYQIVGPDTIAFSMNTFYSNVDNDSITYKNRTYWFDASSEKIYMNDLVNNVDSMLLADLSSYICGTCYWRIGTLIAMQVYNVQYSKISGEIYPSTTDWESLNDPLFTPMIVMTGLSGAYAQPAGLTMTLLDAPNNQDYAEDITLAFNDPPIVRYYFRGIHPKAEKR